MAEQITVGSGGSTSVAPEELESAGDQLGRLGDEVLAITFELASLDRLLTMYSLENMQAPTNAARAELEIDQAQTVLGQVRAAATTLEWSLKFAADGYIITERFVRYLFAPDASSLAWLGGFAGRVAPLGALAVAGGGAAVASNPQVRGHPAFVAFTREALTNADDAAAGVLGVPLPFARLLGADGLGITGLHSAAAMLAGVGAAVGLVRSTPPRVVQATGLSVDGPPAGASGRFERIPAPTDADGAQIVVERYEIPGEKDVFIAYAAGTVDFDPLVADEPFDLESNVVNAVDGSSASAEALRQALVEAGAGTDSRVQLVGYSQGGASAARVAASGDFDVQGLVTFGSPTGQIPLSDDIPVVLVEHTDDLVPALGGRQDNVEATLVTRRVYSDGEVPDADPIPAHLRINYAETARLMDTSADPKLAASLVRLDEML
ncbi:MAG: hypothetical protein ABL886_07060, partial [Rhodoglobus sp.]